MANEFGDSRSRRIAPPVSIPIQQPVGVYAWYEYGDGFLVGGEVAAVESVFLCLHC